MALWLCTSQASGPHNTPAAATQGPTPATSVHPWATDNSRLYSVARTWATDDMAKMLCLRGDLRLHNRHGLRTMKVTLETPK